MERLEKELNIKHTWVAFPLHPDTPAQGLTLEQLFAGRGKDIPAMMARLKQVADAEGLPLGQRSHTYNSRRAQELGKWAEEQGKGEEFHHAAFKAYFADGLNLASDEVLFSLARSLGLGGEEALAVLAQGRFAESVDRDWQRARQCGITAVPTFVIGSGVLVGAHPYSNLLQFARAQGASPRS